MAEKKLNKTYSTYSRNAEVNRATEMRRDNDIVKTPKITIEDVDFAIISFIRDVIKPTVIENGQSIDVPVMYANGEKWAQVQARGFMRDRKGKIMTPIISIRRSSITERDTLKSLGVNQNPSGNDIVFRTTYKFPISLADVSFETTNNTGEDRIVRATIPATVKGTLLMPNEIRRSNIEKRFSVKKVIFGNETDGFNVSDAPQGGY